MRDILSSVNLGLINLVLCIAFTLILFIISKVRGSTFYFSADEDDSEVNEEDEENTDEEEELPLFEVTICNYKGKRIRSFISNDISFIENPYIVYFDDYGNEHDVYMKNGFIIYADEL